MLWIWLPGRNVLTLFFPSFAPETRKAQQSFFGIGSVKFLRVAPRIVAKLDFSRLSPFNRFRMRDFSVGNFIKWLKVRFDLNM